MVCNHSRLAKASAPNASIIDRLASIIKIIYEYHMILVALKRIRAILVISNVALMESHLPNSAHENSMLR